VKGKAALDQVDKPAPTFGWPRSPAEMFGIAAAFFVAMGTILVTTGILRGRLPAVHNGEITYVSAGYLWLPVAAPFLFFAVLYAGLEIGAGRVFDQSTTRIHFVCTFLAVVEAIRVYMFWASSTVTMSRMDVTTASLEGVIAFSLLAAIAFLWNLCTSTSLRKLSARARV
jgi:hypothetical protein